MVREMRLNFSTLDFSVCTMHRDANCHRRICLYVCVCFCFLLSIDLCALFDPLQKFNQFNPIMGEGWISSYFLLCYRQKVGDLDKYKSISLLYLALVLLSLSASVTSYNRSVARRLRRGSLNNPMNLLVFFVFVLPLFVCLFWFS